MTRFYLGEAALAVFADKVGPRSDAASVGRAPVLGVVGHHGEHFVIGRWSSVVDEKKWTNRRARSPIWRTRPRRQLESKPALKPTKDAVRMLRTDVCIFFFYCPSLSVRNDTKVGREMNKEPTPHRVSRAEIKHWPTDEKWRKNNRGEEGKKYKTEDKRATQRLFHLFIYEDAKGG